MTKVPHSSEYVSEGTVKNFRYISGPFSIYYLYIFDQHTKVGLNRNVVIYFSLLLPDSLATFKTNFEIKLKLAPCCDVLVALSLCL